MFNTNMYQRNTSHPHPAHPPPISVPAQQQHPGVPYSSTAMAPSNSQPGSDLSSPSSGDARREPDYSERPGPEPHSTTYEGRAWALDVVQQPVRARMCGFGDKDRRPITPPPCVRLIIMDPLTRKEIDINDIDTSFFVLTVDLWDLDAAKEVNLVKHAANSPSISTVATTSYPPTQVVPSPSQVRPTPFPVNHIPQYQGQVYLPHHPTAGSGSSIYNQMPVAAQGWGGPPPPAGYGQPSHHPYGYNHAGYPAPVNHHVSNSYAQPSPTHPNHPSSHPYPMSPYQSQANIPPDRPSGMFTRNLIGSLSASAFKLNDTDDRVGIWFILQDMSVRTEGWFRLKFNFVNVGIAANNPPLSPHNPSSASGIPPQEINRTTAPVLASCFSQPFQVFSAKKFPGVIESTDLSRTFAQQGIKIPIRKDPQPAGRSGRGRANQDDDYDDQDDD